MSIPRPRRLIARAAAVLAVLASTWVASGATLIVAAPPNTTPSAVKPVSQAAAFDFPAPHRVPGGCSMLLSAEQVAAALGVEPAEVRSRRADIYGLETAAAAQAGMLSCEWEVPAGEPVASSFRGGLNVQVLPGSHAQYQAVEQLYRQLQPEWEAEYPQLPPLLTGLNGAGSLLSCSVAAIGFDSTYQTCWGALEVSGYWVQYDFSAANGQVRDEQAQTQAGVLLGDAVRASLSTAGSPKPVRQLEPGTAMAWDACSTIDGAGQLQLLSDSPTLTLRREYSGVELNIELAALPHSPYQTCFWNQSGFPDEEHSPYSCDDCVLPDDYVEPVIIPDEVGFVQVSMLPGGEWAWSDLKGDSASVASADLQTMGATDAFAGCTPEFGGWCEIHALVGNSVLRITFAFYSDEAIYEDSTPRAVALMQYIVGLVN